MTGLIRTESPGRTGFPAQNVLVCQTRFNLGVPSWPDVPSCPDFVLYTDRTRPVLPGIPMYQNSGNECIQCI